MKTHQLCGAEQQAKREHLGSSLQPVHSLNWLLMPVGPRTHWCVAYIPVEVGCTHVGSHSDSIAEDRNTPMIHHAEHVVADQHGIDVLHPCTVEADDGVGQCFLCCEPVVLVPGGEDVVASRVVTICTPHHHQPPLALCSVEETPRRGNETDHQATTPMVLEDGAPLWPPRCGHHRVVNGGQCRRESDQGRRH